MTTERIDVLAVMDASAEKITFLAQKTGVYHPATELAEARAAVAELIATANSARIVLEARKTMTESDIRAQIEDLRATIERCGGVK